MRISIASPSDGTRAEGDGSGTGTGSETTSGPRFQPGTVEENTVKQIFLKFFDMAGQPIFTTQPKDVTFLPEDPAVNSGNEGKYAEAIVAVDIIEGSAMPAYVLCFINPTNWSDITGVEVGIDDDQTNEDQSVKDNKNLKMEDFRNRKRESYYLAIDGPKYMSMNNSVYFGNDPVSGQSNVKISGTPISYDQLFTTMEAAQAATGDDIVNIYVERYAAKVQFSIDDDATTTDVIEDGYTLNFTPEAWTINADAPSMYVIKRYDNTNAATDEIPTLSQVNDMLEGWTKWNDQTNYRSYWACSPGYYATAFPEVSDQIADAAATSTDTDFTGTGAGQVWLDNSGNVATGAPNALKYYSYNQVVGNGNYTGTGLGITKFKASDNNGIIPFKYVLENTMGEDAFKSKNPKAAAPSILLVGNYTLKLNGNSLPAGTTFYIMNNKIYFASTGVENASSTAMTIKNQMLSENTVLFYKGKDSAGKDTYTAVNSSSAAALVDLLVVKHPSKDVRGNAALAHRYVALQIEESLINDESDVNLYFSPNGTDQYIQVNNNNVSQVNYMLWSQISVAECFKNGKCYYSIPIKHLGWYERTGSKPILDGDESKINWANVQVGDFGLVRNHVYNLKVSEIKGLATGIENLDYPIVPPAEIDKYYIKYKLNILNWRIVPNQSVKL